MKKSELYGIIGSAILTILLFLLLFFILMPGLKKEEDEGIMISFGETIDGGGKNETPAPKVVEKETPKETPKVTPQKVVTPKVTTTKPSKQEVLTQDDNSLAIAEQKKKEKLEKQALERQKQEEAKAIAAENKKKQDAIDKANALMGGMGNGSSNGNGNTTGNTQQGNPAGSGSSGGNSWSLTGRSLTGRLVNPSYDNDVEGKITVSIRVDTNGNVTNASIGSPSTISDADTRNAALTAARNTKFSKGNGIASGSITYNFKLR